MNVFRKFEENLEVLGFDLAPLAWDIAVMPFPTDDDRYEVLKELTRSGTDGG